MMATPQDLEDFAVGFSLTEGIIASPDEIERAGDRRGADRHRAADVARPSRTPTAFRERRRYLAGPTGCGLCGIESLTEAMRTPAVVADDAVFTPQEIMAALDALARLQAINRATRAVHAAAFYRRGRGLVALREDVGRHNALDKLAGALARERIAGRGGIGPAHQPGLGRDGAEGGGDRRAGLVAVSAPTALAVRTAEAAGITLVAVARSDGFEIFTHPQRIQIKKQQSAHVLA